MCPLVLDLLANSILSHAAETVMSDCFVDDDCLELLLVQRQQRQQRRVAAGLGRLHLPASCLFPLEKGNSSSKWLGLPCWRALVCVVLISAARLRVCVCYFGWVLQLERGGGGEGTEGLVG